MPLSHPREGSSLDVPRNHGQWMQYAIVFAIAAILLVVIFDRRSTDLADARRAHDFETAAKIGDARRSIENSFAHLYQGLRTIARMPAITAIERHASNFDTNSRTTIQELYNNLAQNVAVSEIYIVPGDFDPDKVDAVTHKPEEPVLMFDHLIVGRNADQASKGKHEAAQASGAEEIEVFEYRLLKRQTEKLKASYRTFDSIQGLDYPAISSPEVITCDNREYSPSRPDDASRSGIIYSVPYYGADGRMRGMISAIILTSHLRGLLPSSRFGLENRANAFTTSRAAGSDRAAGAALKIRDISGSWSLSATTDPAGFLGRSDVRAAEDMTIVGIAFTVALTTLLLMAVRMHQHQLEVAAARRQELDGLVNARTSELKQKISDIEHSKAALEVARAHADAANAAKSSFLANMSHELRTPLNAIIGFSDIMRRELMGAIGTPAYRGYSEDIHFSGSHLLSVINDILDLSKIEAGKFDLSEEIFALRDVIDEVQRLVASKADAGNVTISNEVLAEVRVRADMRAVRQIAVNLLSNAVKFTPAGGTVRIHCVTLASGAFALHFTDTGCGIAEQDMARVFEMFGQAKYNHARTGTGLGLNIARSLARIHGGDLTLASCPGSGTTATVTLPGERQVSGHGHSGAFVAA